MENLSPHRLETIYDEQNQGVDNRPERNYCLEKHDSNSQESESEMHPKLKHLREKYSKQVIISHLNINSLGSKITEIKELQNRCKFVSIK